MKRWAVSLAFLLLSAPAFAEPIPRSMLNDMAKQCVDEGGVPAFCACFYEQVAERFTLQGYLTIQAEIGARTAKGDELLILIHRNPELSASYQWCERHRYPNIGR